MIGDSMPGDKRISANQASARSIAAPVPGTANRCAGQWRQSELPAL